MLFIERLPKRMRQQQLVQIIEGNPFITDEELTLKFRVSIQTIRLDRLELGIPELRERMKKIATQSLDSIRSLSLDEVIGEVIDLQLDQYGISIFEVKQEHVFYRNRIARGHHIFAQANSLAVAVIDEDIALTSSSVIRFIRPVYLNEKCVAKAYVRSSGSANHKVKVEVSTYVERELVFKGKFVIFRSDHQLGNKGEYAVEDRN